MLKNATLMLISAGICLSVNAGGSQVALQSIKMQAMGHAGVALPLDASTLYFNPAGLSFMPGRLNFTAGVNAVNGLTVYRAEGSNYMARTQNPTSTPLNAYLGGKLGNYISLGIGLYTPFGSTIQWEEGWQGRYLIQNISLRAIYVQPTLSVKFNDYFSLGFGFVQAFGSVNLEKDIPVQDGTGERNYARLEGNARSQSINVGAMISPTDKWKIGITYRGGNRFQVDSGSAEFYTTDFLAASFPKNNAFDGKLPIPATLALGTSYKFNEQFLATFEYDYMYWSVYDSLNIDFYTNTDRLSDTQDPKQYRNSYQIRAGVQYTPCAWFAGRMGYVFDQTPVNKQFYGPETPDMNRNALTLGASFIVGKKVSLDLGYTYTRGNVLQARNAPQNFGGTFQSRAHIFGGGISVTF